VVSNVRKVWKLLASVLVVVLDVLDDFVLDDDVATVAEVTCEAMVASTDMMSS